MPNGPELYQALDTGNKTKHRTSPFKDLKYNIPVMPIDPSYHANIVGLPYTALIPRHMNDLCCNIDL